MNARHLDGDEPTLPPPYAPWPELGSARRGAHWTEPPNPEPQRTHPFVAGLLFGAGLIVALCLAGLAVVALATGLGAW